MVPQHPAPRISPTCGEARPNPLSYTDVHRPRRGARTRNRSDRISQHSQIEWTDATWNPIRGCTKITPGCDHCYAETFAERFRGVSGHPYEQGFDLRLVPEKLAEPLRWKNPKMVFVNSMSDLFHKGVPDDYVSAVCGVMERANWHTYQVLSKRSSRMRDMLQSSIRFAAELPHIWWGVSVEDKTHGFVRIDHLRQAPAAIRFLSIEPLLEDLGEINLDGIHWVIVGGESGPGARPMQKEWVLSIRDQCDRGPSFLLQAMGRRPQESEWTCSSTASSITVSRARPSSRCSMINRVWQPSGESSRATPHPVRDPTADPEPGSLRRSSPHRLGELTSAWDERGWGARQGS